MCICRQKTYDKVTVYPVRYFSSRFNALGVWVMRTLRHFAYALACVFVGQALGEAW